MRKFLIIALVLISTLCEGQPGWLNYSGAKNYAMWTTKWLQADNTFYWKGDTIKKELLGYFDLRSDSLRMKYIGGSWSPWYYAGRGAYVLPVASASTLGGIKVGSGLSITNGMLSSTGGDLSGYVPYSGATTDLNMGTKRVKSNGSFVPGEDGTKLYHSVRWFTPTAGSTLSTSGTTVTTTGSSQFVLQVINSKIVVNGEARIITARTSSSVVTVDSPFSQNYTNVPETNWGVYSLMLSEDSNGYLTLYGPTGNYVNISSSTFTLKSAPFGTNGGELGISITGIVSLASNRQIIWSSTTGSSGTKDVGLQRNAAGALEIYDGITAGAFRDLKLRTLTASGQFVSSLATGTSPLNVASTTLNTNLNADLLDGYHSSSFVLTNDSRLTDSRPASDVYSWAKALTKPDYTWTEITSKPTFAAVATSGDYNDLLNKPAIGTTTNAHVLKFDTGTTEGTDLYTFNGSAAKTVDIKAGSNIILTKSAGSITIASAGGSGATNLTYTSAATTGTVNSDTGTDATIPAATTSIAGLLTATDKIKLNGLSNYGYWNVGYGGSNTDQIGAGTSLYFEAGSGMSINYSSASRTLTFAATGSGSGTVTSVSATAPTGLSVSVTNPTTTPAIALSYATGYSLPTNANQTNWGSAYTNMGKAMINGTSGYYEFSSSYFTTTAGALIRPTYLDYASSGSTMLISSGGVYTELQSKQNTLVSGTNIKTVNGNSLLGSGDITISGGGGTWGSITGTLSNQTDLQTALNAKAALSGSTSQAFSASSLTLAGAITGATTITASGLVTGSNFQLSDRRLKRDIRPINVSKFSDIKLYAYTMKADTTNRTRYGVIAQDVEKIAPELIYVNDEGIRAVNYIDLLIAKIADLENRIKNLENEK